MKNLTLLHLLFLLYLTSAATYQPTQRLVSSRFLLEENSASNHLEVIDKSSKKVLFAFYPDGSIYLRTDTIRTSTGFYHLKQLATSGTTNTTINTNVDNPLKNKLTLEEYLKNKTESQIYSAFNKSNTKRKGLSTIDVCKILEISIYKPNTTTRIDSKKNLVKRIYDYIQTL